MEDLQTQLEEALERISILENQMRQHAHDGFLGGQIFIKSIFGAFETVSVAPTTIPKTTYDQFKIYTNGSVFRFYWYDTVNNIWKFTAVLPTGLAGSKAYFVSDGSGGAVTRRLTFSDGILTSET